MKFVYSSYDAKQSFFKLIKQALEGHEVIITRGPRGKPAPVVKLVPYTENGDYKFGCSGFSESKDGSFDVFKSPIMPIPDPPRKALSKFNPENE